MDSNNAELRRGWPALLALAVGNGAGLAAVPLFSLSSFTQPLSKEFGWSPAQVGVAATVITAGIFITGPLAGRLCDRFGVRRVALPSVVLLSVGLALLTLTGPSLALLYVGYALLTIGGAGTTSVSYSRAVSLRFDRQRGLALGLMMSGSGFSAFLLPLMLGHVIPEYGWRAGFLLCALLALVPFPLGLALLRDGPGAARSATEIPIGLSLREAMSGRRLWTMVAAAMLFSSAMGGVIVHLIPALQGVGMTAGAAARSASLLGIGMIIGRLSSGFLLDRVHGPLLAALLMLTTACGFLILHFAWLGLAPLAVLMIGVSLGSEGDLLAYFTSRYFGLRSYAEIFGWMFGVLGLGTAVGPLLILVMSGRVGYLDIMLIFAGLCVLAGLLLATLGKYPHWK